MNIHGKAYDTHPDLLIQRYKGGIRLAKPNSDICESINRISALAKMPVGMWFTDVDSAFIDGNDIIAETVGSPSSQDFIGLNAEKFCAKEFANELIANDRAVIESKQMRLIEETGLRRDGSLIQALAFKFPWYSDDTVIGTFGLSINIDQKSLKCFSGTIAQLTSVGLLHPSKSMTVTNITDQTNYLSKREKEVLTLVMQSKTAKEIAGILFISNRTVEHHIESIKMKANCDSKFELIHKFRDTNI